MTKDMQVRVRVLAEDFLKHAHDRVLVTMEGLEAGDEAYGTMLSGFEQARQLALMTEELHAVKRMMSEQLAMANYMVRRMEALLPKEPGNE